MFPLEMGLKFVPPLHLGRFFEPCPFNMGLFFIESISSFFLHPPGKELNASYTNKSL